MTGLQILNSSLTVASNGAIFLAPLNTKLDSTKVNIANFGQAINDAAGTFLRTLLVRISRSSTLTLATRPRWARGVTVSSGTCTARRRSRLRPIRCRWTRCLSLV